MSRRDRGDDMSRRDRGDDMSRRDRGDDMSRRDRGDNTSRRDRGDDMDRRGSRRGERDSADDRQSRREKHREHGDERPPKRDRERDYKNDPPPKRERGLDDKDEAPPKREKDIIRRDEPPPKQEVEHRGIPQAKNGREEEVLELKVGQKVRVQGLQKNPEKNGAIGTLIEFNEEKGRWVVEFAANASNNFKAENLDPVPDLPDDDEEPPTGKVYITNLSGDTTQDDLVKLFGGIGALAREPVRNHKGTAMGFQDQWPYSVKLYKPGTHGGDGCVEYMDKFAAKAAIRAFHGYKLNGSRLGVAYAGQGRRYEKRDLTVPWAEREENIRARLDGY